MEQVKNRSRSDLPSNYLLLKRPDHVRVTHCLVYRQPAPTPSRLLGMEWTTLLIVLYALGLFLLGGHLNFSSYGREVKQWLFDKWA